MTMALVHCPECQKEVSTEALACPQCAYPFPGKKNGLNVRQSENIQSCHDCGRVVSKHAKACPHCGLEIPQQTSLTGEASTEETWLCTHCGTPYTRKVRHSGPHLSPSGPVPEDPFQEVPEDFKPSLPDQSKVNFNSRGRNSLPLWQDAYSVKDPAPPRYPRSNRKSLLVGGGIVLLVALSAAFGALWHLKGINPLDLLALIQNWT